MDLARKNKKMWVKMNTQDSVSCERDWSYLPTDVADQILDRLVGLGDYIRFGAVSKSWQSTSLDKRNYRGSNTNQEKKKKKDNDNDIDIDSEIDLRIVFHQLPMLMIPRYNKACFYSVTHKKVLDFQLPFSYTNRLIGSSFGWLISADDELSITLFNPFSGDKIQLPPVLFIQTAALRKGGHPYTDYFFVKAILSADPSTHPDEFIVVVISGAKRLLAFIRPGGGGGGGGGDKKQPNLWFHYKKLHGFCDVISNTFSRFEFFAVHDSGRIYGFDTTDVSYTYDSIVRAFMINTAAGSPNVGTAFWHLPPALNPEPPCQFRYLVETTSGELLQVLRYTNTRRDLTRDFRVFKLVINHGVASWVALPRFGQNNDHTDNDVLFLGDSCHSRAVKASDFPGIRPGSIYFTLPFPYPEIEEPSDMGFVNLQSGVQQPPIERFNISDRYFDCWSVIHNPRPMWLIPTFQEEAVKEEVEAKRPNWSLKNSRIKYGWIKKNKVSTHASPRSWDPADALNIFL